ncbi:MAG TPA: DUF1667 domain-containing protein [Rectinemataceae bacterium]|nr:DUF1667 domain-containing protein [Rectinemataceae bacterium]
MSQNMTCITCPIGCSLSIEREEGGGILVSGNRCPRGAAYAREELLSPRRTVTATVRARGHQPGSAPTAADCPRRIPCRSLSPFPRDRIDELLSVLYAMELELPVERGRILLKDALGTGIDIAVTRTIG